MTKCNNYTEYSGPCIGLLNTGIYEHLHKTNLTYKSPSRYYGLLEEGILCAALFDFHLGPSFIGDEGVCFHVNDM